MHRVPALCFLVLMPMLTIRGQEGPDSTKRIGVAAIPLIDYDPTFSATLGVVVQAFYQLDRQDTISPSSSTGAFGIYTFNGTYFLGAFQKFHMAEDRWRILMAGGHGNVNFQFWQELPLVGGTFIGFNTEATFAAVRVERAVFNNLYVGLNGVYSKTRTDFELPDWIPDSLKSEEIGMHNAGYQINYDKREHQYHPHEGYHLTFKHSFFPEWLTGESAFQNFTVTYNHYFNFGNDKHIPPAVG